MKFNEFIPLSGQIYLGRTTDQENFNGRLSQELKYLPVVLDHREFTFLSEISFTLPQL